MNFRLFGKILGLTLIAGSANATDLIFRSLTRSSTLGSDVVASRQLLTTNALSSTTYSKATISGLLTPPTSSTQFVVSGSNTTSWVSDPLSKSATISRSIAFFLKAKITAGAPNATITAELFKVSADGTTVGLGLVDVLPNRPALTTSFTSQTWSRIPNSVFFAVGDRVGARLHIDNAGSDPMFSGTTVVVSIDDAGTFIRFTDTLTFTAFTYTLTATRTVTPTISPTRTSTPTLTRTPTTTQSFTVTPTFTSTCVELVAGPIVTGSGGAVTITWQGLIDSTGDVIYSLYSDLSSPTTVTDADAGDATHIVPLSLTAQCNGQRMIFYRVVSDSGAESCGIFSFQICSNATLTPTPTISPTPGTSLNCMLPDNYWISKEDPSISYLLRSITNRSTYGG